jgi:hypothetical protein
MLTRRWPRVDVAGMGVLCRTGQLHLDPPGLRSPNGACRLFRAARLMALNLAREEDRDLVPAWLAATSGPSLGRRLSTPGATPSRISWLALTLGLPAAAVGETKPTGWTQRFCLSADRPRPAAPESSTCPPSGPSDVAILAAMGAGDQGRKRHRRDPTRTATPDFFVS